VPLYFWRLRAVDAVELVAHRILWGLPLLALLITARRGWRRYRDAVVDIRSLRILLGTTVLISINWFVFVYAIVTNRATEASLGYYINPLVSVALGMIVLKERLRLAQWGALVLAAGGVAYLTIASGSPPWLSLLLAFSFGFYGLLRKQMRADSITGLSVEMTLLLPFAIVYLGAATLRGDSAFTAGDDWAAALALAAGLITIAPLIWFASAARILRLSTIGFMQYMAPTGQLLIAIFVFQEPFTTARAVAFSAIWAALAVYTADAFLRRPRPEPWRSAR